MGSRTQDEKLFCGLYQGNCYINTTGGSLIISVYTYIIVSFIEIKFPIYYISHKTVLITILIFAFIISCIVAIITNFIVNDRKR